MNRALCILLLALVCSSCTLDPFLYNERQLKRYDLSTAVIPESNRAQWTFSSGGNMLYGFWTFPPPDSQNGFTILYCHGNKHDITEYWDRVEMFYKMGFRCFIFDYRGFGRSEGTPSGSGLYEDGRAALRFIQQTFSVDSAHLVFYGYSLGNVVSIDLAANVMQPYALIAEAPFASEYALFSTATPLDFPPDFVLDDKLDNVARVSTIHTSYLQLHGDADDFVPWPSNGRLVWEAAPQPKQLVLVPGANHDNIPQTMGYDAYKTLLLGFLTDRE
jgi:uncharacterized protein